MSKKAIGGYFALERGSGTGLAWINDATGYRSARSAVAAALTALQPTTVWVPNFVCGAINDTLRSISANVRRYTLTKSFDIPELVNPASTDLLICIDYFGINGAAVDRSINRFGVKNVLVDASQSLFFRHWPGCTTVYSPRKFLGIPDGGLIRTSLPLASRYASVEADSIARSQHLLYRLADLTDAGYTKFQEAEASLSGCEPEALSQLTATLLRSVDVEEIAALRIRNYQLLATLLRPAGFDIPCLPLDAVPLCCPVRCDEATHVRKELAERRIFTPTYWLDAAIPDNDHVALTMRDRTVYLPCDQRCGEPELLSIANAMIESMGAS